MCIKSTKKLAYGSAAEPDLEVSVLADLVAPQAESRMRPLAAKRIANLDTEGVVKNFEKFGLNPLRRNFIAVELTTDLQK